MKAKLFISILYKDEDLLNKVLKNLKNKFGDIENYNLTYPFTFTDYYEKEMGKNLIKKFIVFKDLIDKKDIGNIKIETIKIEKKYSKDNKRTINLDPAYLTKGELVLPSVKEKPYKIKKDNVFLHKIYEFNKEVKTFYHTFPDFKTEKVKDFFKKINQTFQF